MTISRRSLLLGTAAAIAGAGAPVASARAATSSSTYYLSSTGVDDPGAGTTSGTAWRTVDFLNDRMRTGQVQPGDRVLFRAGDGFDGGVLAPLLGSAPSSPVTTFGVWGEGAAPVFSSYKTPKAWKPVGASRWSVDLGVGSGQWSGRATADVNVGFLLVDGQPFGMRRAGVAELAHPWDFAVDGSTLTVVSENDPSVAEVRCALDETLFRGASAIRVEGLAFIGTGSHGYQQRYRTANVEVADCTFDLIGGSVLEGSRRYGNGIEVYIGGSEAAFHDNRISRVYDTATTVQGAQTDTEDGWSDVAFTNNTITDCTQSFEHWSQGTTGSGARGVTFRHNTCRGAGMGWGWGVRPDQDGTATHLLFYDTELPVDITVTDNVFDGSRQCYLSVADTARTPSGRPPAELVSDRNRITLDPDQRIQNHDDLSIEDAPRWVTETGLEVTSTFTISG